MISLSLLSVLTKLIYYANSRLSGYFCIVKPLSL
nr:MAG TPA: hypothetical protein [Crassvirales sp.]DAM76604.1 MAG TPA: hypothetical protein [Caudoviricetes sp.]